MRKIVLTQGKFALVDNDMYSFLDTVKWHAAKLSGRFYAARAVPRLPGEKRRVMYMHHVVAGHPVRPLQIDHINGSGLNNQRHNLRIVSHRMNMRNRKEHLQGHLLGTSFNSRQNKWCAQIWLDGKCKHLGYFTSRKAAAACFLAFQNSLPIAV